MLIVLIIQWRMFCRNAVAIKMQENVRRVAILLEEGPRRGRFIGHLSGQTILG